MKIRPSIRSLTPWLRWASEPNGRGGCLRALGRLSVQDALEVLKSAGTSSSYAGLYRSVSTSQPLDPTELSQLEETFREIVELPPMTESMVLIEERFDRLKEMCQNGWVPTPSHPDESPSHLALLLREEFTELLRAEDTLRESAELKDLMRENESDAVELEKVLQKVPVASSSINSAAASNLLDKISRNCTSCHRQFRDIPLNQKLVRRPNSPMK